MARQVLPVFVTAGDVDALKTRLRAAVTGTDLGVQACSGLPDTDRAAWGLFYAGVLRYCAAESSTWSAAAQMNEGQQLEDELYEWQKKLLAKGCDVTAVDPQPREPAGASIVKWGALAIALVAGAVIAHEAAATVRELVPRRAQT